MPEVPRHIVNAVNQLLSEYGESYDPDGKAKGRGFLTPGKAAEYLGVSKCTFYRLVRNGKIPVRKINDSSKNGLALVSINDLDAFAKG